mmetsp:Transcript_38514/g.102454  ORF Transcript_38514/g.102454 Transcript_38514/m.102454 type:complete len:158 (-) Transcript_38514:194-667(-)
MAVALDDFSSLLPPCMVQNTFIHFTLPVIDTVEKCSFRRRSCSAPAVLNSLQQAPLESTRTSSSASRTASTAPTDGVTTLRSKSSGMASAGHVTRRCKPCAFVWREGCKRGDLCPFCHLCEAGEKKRRRKENKAKQHMRKLMHLQKESDLVRGDPCP